MTLQGRFVDNTGAHHWVNDRIENVYAGDTFPGCKAPPGHVLTLDLSVIPEFSAELQAVGTIHVVYAACEGCDAWMMQGGNYEGEMVFRRETDGRYTPEEPTAYRNNCRSPSPNDLYDCRGIELVPEGDPEEESTGICVGGDPKWMQGPAAPSAPGDWRYVARIYSYWLGFGGQHLFVYVEPATARIAILMQCT